MGYLTTVRHSLKSKSLPRGRRKPSRAVSQLAKQALRPSGFVIPSTTTYTLHGGPFAGETLVVLKKDGYRFGQTVGLRKVCSLFGSLRWTKADYVLKCNHELHYLCTTS